MASGMSEQPCYVYIARPTDADLQPNEMQVREVLEKGSLSSKVEALKKLIHALLNGERVSSTVLMYVIRFCLPSQDHLIKKLLLMFWEVVPKRNADGKLLQEMILVCDAYRKDLQHPNEFVRGSTLRFLCRLKEPELIEPLMPAIRACLEYRHAYVRRNAVLAAFTIYKSFDFLIPDAPELVQNFLDAEQDASCKRNAFMMLLHADRRLALDYLSTCLEQVITFSNILQLIVVQLIYTVCLGNASETTRFLRCVYNLLQSSSSAVRYESACVLISLTSSPQAIKAALDTLIELLNKESDNNVKLIVLDRIIELRQNRAVAKVLEDVVMDILRMLHCADFEVQKKALSLAYELVTSRNVNEVVSCLRKEVQATSSASNAADQNQKYRQLLVKTMHNVCIRFAEVATTLMPSLLELLSDAEEAVAVEILVFVREAVISMPDLRPLVVSQLLQLLPSMQNVSTLRFALWILGEYCQSAEEVERFVAVTRSAFGPLPMERRRTEGAEGGDDATTETKSAAATQLLNPDGTYAMHSALTALVTTKQKSILRKFLIDGHFFFFVCLASTLTKAALRYAQVNGGRRSAVNKLNAEVMFMLSCVVQFGRTRAKGRLSIGDEERIKAYLKLLAVGGEERLGRLYTLNCRESLSVMLKKNKEARKDKDLADGGGEEKVKLVAPDHMVTFSQLLRAGDGLLDGKENVFDASLSQALGQPKKGDQAVTITSRLDNITQLSGFSDPVYAEAYIKLNSYDITLDCFVVNQTGDTLEAVTLELATLGDLKLVEKPLPITLAAHDFATIKTSIKVSSTENGVIFGTLSYDVRGSSGDRNCIYLNDIHIDIMDYIVPALCSDEEFRQMWSEFEWENKVAVMTTICDLKEYLAYLMKQTNMRCLTPDEVLSGESGFLAANLYARSLFGEDALANLSIEKASTDPRAPVVGHVRIRAKSQGMALSMGDRISKVQKTHMLAGHAAA